MVHCTWPSSGCTMFLLNNTVQQDAKKIKYSIIVKLHTQDFIDDVKEVLLLRFLISWPFFHGKI
jgi:hypothetical protein